MEKNILLLLKSRVNRKQNSFHPTCYCRTKLTLHMNYLIKHGFQLISDGADWKQRSTAVSIQMIETIIPTSNDKISGCKREESVNCDVVILQAHPLTMKPF